MRMGEGRVGEQGYRSDSFMNREGLIWIFFLDSLDDSNIISEPMLENPPGCDIPAHVLVRRI